MAGFSIYAMCNWLEDAIDFLFPEPVEVDMDGVEIDSSITEFCREVDGEKQLTATDAPLPEIPPMFKAEPAVREAQLIVQGKSTSRALPRRAGR